MPSSNVKGGSDSAYNISDGVPYVGVLSADAQALSGYVAQARLRASYRLHMSDRHRTLVSTDVYTKRVTLTKDAKAAAPLFDPDTLNATALSFGLVHSRQVGAEGTLVGLHGGTRFYWQDETLAYTALTAGASAQTTVAPRLVLSGNLSYESRAYEGGGDGEIKRIGAGLTYTFGNGNRLTGEIAAQDSATPVVTFDSRALTGKLSYALADPIWSMLLSAGIGASFTDYPDYSLGIIPVPGGRQDDAVFFDLEATFADLEFAGFSPSLKVRHTTTNSNVSRYDTAEWAVSLGIRSNF